MSDRCDDRPALARKTRFRRDPLTGQPLLLFPEGVLRLNSSGAAILALCDGRRSVREIVRSLRDRFQSRTDEVAKDVDVFFSDLDRRGLLIWNAAPENVIAVSAASSLPPQPLSSDNEYRPLGLLAELTYRCPLGCPYCSNPTALRHNGADLSTEDWDRVIREAAELGVLHVHFSGGEPILHPGLPQLVATARASGLYSNLLTSGIPFSRATAETLRSAGLDHVQLSLQSDEASLADTIAGRRTHDAKLEAARLIRELDWPLTLNVVLHRANIQRLPHLIALAEELDADRLELANVQFYGWAHRNRSTLLPDAGALREAAACVAAARDRLQGRLRIDYVLPDALADRPKPCMEGWGRRYLTINPQGDVLPCPTASCIESLRFDNVRQRSLRWIWEESEAFNRFRGTAWMPEPCRSCELRHQDFGGCRCQAALLTGDANNTDPACSLAPHRSKLIEAFQIAQPVVTEAPFAYRRYPVAASASDAVAGIAVSPSD
ncbi:MAG TPA: pyrroloquinoline quinone biosynthesis protein PqqE [Planctomycetaceae bacterium]|jgi:pyrroloquinoline quinone biosynthesis protein E|nr:pyrroloquinoline quinone biosynthesis protein PqqE [Planctomycetaceae bacterium]